MNDDAVVYEFMLNNASNSGTLRMFAIDESTGKIGVTREGFAEVQRDAIKGLANRYKRTYEAKQRALESVEEAGQTVGQGIVRAGQEAVRTVASLFGTTPTLTEEEKARRAQARARRERPATLVAETSMGETGGRAETAAMHTEVPPAEAPAAEEKRASGSQEATTITTPQSDLRGNTYEFRIKYDPSKLEPGYTDADLRSLKFFEKPENRDAIINFTYRNISLQTDWYDVLGKPLFHRTYSRLFEVVDFVLVSPENKPAQHFAVYIDRDKAEQLGIDTSDPLALIRSGVILRIMQGAVGNERRWRLGSTEEVIAAWDDFIKRQRDENGYTMRVGRG